MCKHLQRIQYIINNNLCWKMKKKQIRHQPIYINSTTDLFRMNKDNYLEGTKKTPRNNENNTGTNLHVDNNLHIDIFTSVWETHIYIIEGVK